MQQEDSNHKMMFSEPIRELKCDLPVFVTTCLRTSKAQVRQNLSMEKGAGHKVPPLLKSYWQWVAAGISF